MSARSITSERSCSPARKPESGSATIGHLRAAASVAIASTGSPWDSGPAITSPRRPRNSAARRRTSSSSGTRRALENVPDSSIVGSASEVVSASSSGSRNGKLRWTAPAGDSAATATARMAVERAWRSISGSSAATGMSTNHFAWVPKRFVWSIVCEAPRSRSSDGRSAVSTSSGTRERLASTTAGSKLAAAVPEVQTSATGSPSCRAMPSAK